MSRLRRVHDQVYAALCLIAIVLAGAFAWVLIAQLAP